MPLSFPERKHLRTREEVLPIPYPPIINLNLVRRALNIFEVTPTVGLKVKENDDVVG